MDEDCAVWGKEHLDLTFKRDQKVEEKIKNLFGKGSNWSEVFICYMLPQLMQRVPKIDHKWIPDIIDHAAGQLTKEEKQIYIDEAKRFERPTQNGNRDVYEEIAYAFEEDK